MELTVGAILEGKVKSITNFGAFISLPENKTGLVHISEVANAYVSDVRAHLTEGQDVKVMVIGNEAGCPDLPILWNVNAGHAYPTGVFPLGLRYEINCGAKQLRLLEPAAT